MGNIGLSELVLLMVLWVIPIALAIWVVRSLHRIARTQRDMADSIRRIEHRLGLSNQDRSDPPHA